MENEKKFRVNEIIKTDNAIHGIVVWDADVVYNLDLVFGKEKRMAEKVAKSVEQSGHERGYFIEKMGNYVAYVKYDKVFKFTMKLSNFYNNIDNALDEHLILESQGWSTSERDKYSRIAHETIGSTDLYSLVLHEVKGI